MRTPLRVVPAVVGLLVAFACGGQTAGSDPGCVDRPVLDGDTACTSDDDCVYQVTGHVCTGECPCAYESLVNKAAAARLDNEPLPPSGAASCECTVPATPVCVAGQCTPCNSALPAGTPKSCPTPPGSSPGGGDGGANDGSVAETGPGEGGLSDGGAAETGLTDAAMPTCISIDPSQYVRDCSTAADCFPIMAGNVCVPSDCPCQVAYVNVSEESRYEFALASLPAATNACSCPAPPPAQCVAGQCTP